MGGKEGMGRVKKGEIKEAASQTSLGLPLPLLP